MAVTYLAEEKLNVKHIKNAEEQDISLRSWWRAKAELKPE